MRIEFAQDITKALQHAKPDDKAQTGNDSFANKLNDAIHEVDSLQQEADTLALKAATGDMDNIHQVMIAMEKASLALEFAVQVRNKAIEAYQELMRTQV